jgi:hypothetical protein
LRGRGRGKRVRVTLRGRLGEKRVRVTWLNFGGKTRRHARKAG